MSTESTYRRPLTVAGALQEAEACGGNFRYIAGGTDVLVNRSQGNDTATCLIDITGIEELKRIETDGQTLRIGALVSLDELAEHAIVRERFPALAEAARAVASPVIRKTATLGGNLLCENRCIFYNQSEWWREAVGYCLKCDGDICIATGGKKNCFSKFVSDTAVVLISLNAMIDMGETGGPAIAVQDLYTGDGVTSKRLPPTTLIRSIRIPLAESFACVFRKLRPRQSVDFTSLTTAVSVAGNGRIRIVLGGVDPRPVIIDGNAGEPVNDLVKRAVKKPRIVDNDVYSRNYRKEMIAVFLERSFEELNLC